MVNKLLIKDYDRYSNWVWSHSLTKTIFAHTHLSTKLSVLQLSKYPQYAYSVNLSYQGDYAQFNILSKIWLCCDSLYHGESQANTYAIYIANLLYSHNRLSELWLYFVSRSERELCVLRPILLRFLIEKRNGRVWRACPMNVTDYSFKHESYLTKITIADPF